MPSRRNATFQPCACSRSEVPVLCRLRSERPGRRSDQGNAGARRPPPGSAYGAGKVLRTTTPPVPKGEWRLAARSGGTCIRRLRQRREQGSLPAISGSAEPPGGLSAILPGLVLEGWRRATRQRCRDEFSRTRRAISLSQIWYYHPNLNRAGTVPEARFGRRPGRVMD
jgi:hypothetical protein